MKLYNSMGPNPHVVRMFIKEMELDIDSEEIDLMGAKNRESDFLKINPMGQLPALVMDSGDILAEITVICEYLDAITKDKTLIGKTPEEQAETRMWVRRVDLNICEPMANGFRFGEGLGLFKDRIVTIPEASAGLKKIAQTNLKWLDEQMEGKEFIVGNRFTLADILLFCFLTFGATIGQTVPAELKNVTAWQSRIGERPSAGA
ncbi:MAG: glutathione S-transferase N-terminal domain-containing protein [Pseudomonadales bacterium]|nr:glutathione S-transferase N-terminal domain-containing protein [Pseudomonadales bacterium]